MIHRLPGFLCALLASLPLAAQSYVISTVAGTDMNNVPATSVELPVMNWVAADGAGNAYFTIGGFGRVYKINSGGQLSVVAGIGALGFSGDGGPATSAQVQGTRGIATDTAGNIYFADGGTNRIRRVDFTTGVITTVAGNGTAGFAGDGGAATSAQLNSPQGIAIDSSGNLFIADFGNQRIRRVSGGIITTVAGNGVAGFAGDGGPATSAQLNGPVAVAAVLTGNLFICDSGNQRVRLVSAGIITTVAGNGVAGFNGDGISATSAQLSNPQGLAADSANLYIADTSNQRVRRVTGGLIFTAAGNGIPGFLGDGGAATNAQLRNPAAVALEPSGNLLIADGFNKRVRRVNAISGVITTIAGGGSNGDGGPATSARLYRPFNIVFEAGGAMLIADSLSDRVRRISNSGNMSTAAGTGIPGFSGDGGPANGAQFHNPSGIARDSVGNVYLADTNNNRVRRGDASTGIVTTAAGNGPCGYSGDGGPAISARLCRPFGSVAVDSGGNVFITDTNNSAIRRLDAGTGVITTVAGTGVAGFNGDHIAATSAQLNFPNGIALDGAGNLYIADEANYRVRRVDAATKVITTVAGNGSPVSSGDGGLATSAGSDAFSVAVDAGGNLYIADQLNYRIRRVDAATGIITTIAGTGVPGFSGDGGAATAARIGDVYGLTADSTGKVWVVDGSNNRIRLLTPATVVTIATSQPGLSVTVDGTSYAAPQAFTWIAGTSHTVSAATPQSGAAGTRYAFSGWADGNSSNPRNITTPAIATTYTANFTTQYQLTTAVSPAGGGVIIPGGGFYNSGTSVQLTASAGLGNQFTGWSGDLSGSTNPASILMSAPHSVTANFGTLTGTSFTISGQVTFSGAALSGVTVAISGTQTGSTTTNGSGFYTLSGVASGGTYNVTPSLGGYGFDPYTATFNNLSGNQTANFIALPGATLQFYPIPPCRIADTRSFTGPPGPLGPPSLTAGSSRSFPVLSSACGIPSSAVAYSLNVSALPLTNYLQYVTVWPTGQGMPVASTLNSWDGRLVANAAIIPAGASGAISIFASNATDVFFDINGYFAPPGAGGLQFYPMTPCRVADTRSFTGPPGPLGPPSMTAGSSRSFPVLSSACGIPATAVAYSLNMSAVPSTNYLGYLTTWGTGQPQPIASTLNSWTGTIVANAAIVPAGTAGAISIFVSDTTDVFFDINGYFAPPGVGGLQYHPLSPCRVADTRSFTGPPGPLGPPSMTAGSSRSFPVLSSACGIPSAAAAYAFNVTAVPTTGYLQYLTAWGTGLPQPIASTLNSWTGTIVPNAAFVPAGTGGAISIFVSDPSDVFFDINGYFAP